MTLAATDAGRGPLRTGAPPYGGSDGTRSALPPVVMLHGLRTDPQRFFAAFLGGAERHARDVVVPDCRGDRWRGYQTLGPPSDPLRAAAALHEIVDDVLVRSAAGATKVDLVGYSAGAQCAHRFALLFPDRVRRLVVASAGWYTELTEQASFPFGVRPGRRSAWRRVDIDAFLSIPARVLVGERDVQRDAALRTGRDVDRQGIHRIARAVRWVEGVRAEASRRGLEAQVSLELLPGATHSFRTAIREGGLSERLFAFLGTQERAAQLTGAGVP